MNKLVLALALLCVPFAARAQVGVRLGLEANLAQHVSGQGTTVITDNWPLAGDFMLSYWTPGEILSLDAEISEQFYANAPAGASGRIGTVFRPGIRLSPPLLPLYVRAAVPINFETATGSREKADLRLGVGLTLPLVLFKIYLEGDADFPISSQGSVSAFNSYAFWLSGGLDFRF